MIRHPEFSIGEWDKAPVYWGPGFKEFHQHNRTALLDFETLEMIARMQEETGAFRSSDDSGTSKAPIKIGDTPASFVRVTSTDEENYLLHAPLGPEIFVVLNGLLTVRNQRFGKIFYEGSDTTAALASGDVITLEPEEVEMKAHGLGIQAESLALAIMDVAPEQRGLILLQDGFNLRQTN